MICLSDEEIHSVSNYSSEEYKDYIAKNPHVESCKICKEKLKNYKTIDEKLKKNIFLEPPSSIISFVMEKINAKSPSFQSIIISILFNISIIIFLIYANYGFAKDSLIKALSVTGNFILHFMQSLFIFLTSLFEYTKILTGTINKLTEIIFGIGADFEIIVLTFIILISLISFSIYKMTYRILSIRRI